MGNLFEGVNVVAKIMELVISNGKCTICGKQIGPVTGDPRTFESMDGVRKAFRDQVFYWMKHLAQGQKIPKECSPHSIPHLSVRLYPKGRCRKESISLKAGRGSPLTARSWPAWQIPPILWASSTG